MSRWEHQDDLDRMDAIKTAMPDSMVIRKQTVEHPLGTIKCWMGATHFLLRGIKKVKIEMDLQVLAYNLKRMINIMGAQQLIKNIQATS